MSAQSKLLEQAKAICFDTSVARDLRAMTTMLKLLREKYPSCRLLVPAWVLAELARQWRVAGFGESRRHAFLSTLKLHDVQIPAFDRDVALFGWPEVTGRFGAREWSWEMAPLQRISRERPCAQRCRTGDHIVYALARHNCALLATADNEMAEQARQDGYKPGVMLGSELRKLLNLPAPASEPRRSKVRPSRTRLPAPDEPKPVACPAEGGEGSPSPAS